MVPKYLALFIANEDKGKGWNGSVQKAGAVFGKGAYFDPKKSSFLTSLPLVDAVNPTIAFRKGHEGKEKLAYSPTEGKEATYDYTFEKECAGASEYAYGLWTRWLTTIPRRVLTK